MRRLSTILIAGSSHVGKTTLASRLAAALGWKATSTDSLARHPGRPWPNIPRPVEEYYASLSPETIYWFLKVHHDNMWPRIRRMIDDDMQAGRPLLFEGSALRPEFVASLASETSTVICLHADDDFLRERMQAGAGYRQADHASRAIMDKFIERSLRDNLEIRRAAEEHGLRLVDAADPAAVGGVFEELVGAAG